LAALTLARRLLFTAARRAAPAAGKRQLLVDVSIIARHDARTGIQRVVRAILLQLLREPPPQYEVRAVRAGFLRGYRYADAYAATLHPGTAGSRDGRRITIGAGDVFLALDLSAPVLPRHRLQLAWWKARGVRIYFVVHDLLPLLKPEWFTPRAARRFRAWLRALALLADGALCTSRTGTSALRALLEKRLEPLHPALRVDWFHLGADVEASAPSKGIATALQQRIDALRGRMNILIVGTIEPRKAHAQALGAFELLWKVGEQANLVLVGQSGWLSETLTARLRDHPQAGERLHWFENATDEALQELYRLADGVFVPSFDEGFGLPVVEAARHGKPLLLRAIPIFHELAGANAAFFSAADAPQLAAELATWLRQVRQGSAISSRGMGCLTWRESTHGLLDRLRPQSMA
jgi:glycosyltransferase involved in cell wall biosynthesis